MPSSRSTVPAERQRFGMAARPRSSSGRPRRPRSKSERPPGFGTMARTKVGRRATAGKDALGERISLRREAHASSRYLGRWGASHFAAQENQRSDLFPTSGVRFGFGPRAGSRRRSGRRSARGPASTRSTERSSPDDLGDLLDDLLFHVHGPKHLGDVHRQEEFGQQQGLDGHDGEVLNQLADPDTDREVIRLTGN
jgi:hypothetical protein